MKKLAIVAFGAMCAPLFLATPALAGSDLTPPKVLGEVVGNVAGNRRIAAPGRRLAFTGTQITVWMVAAAALLLLGVGLLVAATAAREASSILGLLHEADSVLSDLVDGRREERVTLRQNLSGSGGLKPTTMSRLGSASPS
jgi:hypothetical protein